MLQLLERCTDKPNVGETVLYKLLQFSGFKHYEQYEEHLTGALIYAYFLKEQKTVFIKLCPKSTKEKDQKG